jgi:hypothetical protein
MYTTFESPRDHGMPLVTRTPQALKRGRRDLPNRAGLGHVCPPPRHHEIDNHGRDDQHDPEEARVAKPSHGISPCTTLSPVPSSSVSMSYYTNAGGATRHRLERSSGLSPHIQVIRVEGQRVPVGEEHKASRLPAVVHDHVRGREKKGDDEGEVQKSHSASRVSGQSSGSLGGIERNA